MRFVEVLVAEGKVEAILGLLDEEGVEYSVTPETKQSKFEAAVSFPLPTGAIAELFGRLHEIGIDDDAYIVVTEPETVVSREYSELARRYADDTIANVEIVARAEELAPSLSTYVVMTLVSTIVATAGLFLDSSAVVIGAMLIAPVLGPAVSTAVGTVIAERDLHRRGIALQILGVLLSILGAAAFALVAHETFLVEPAIDVREIPAIQERLVPDLLSLVIALGAGVAAVFSLTRDVSQSLVGALIAVALIPPAATTGIMLAWNYPVSALAAFLLTVVNLLTVNFVALAVLWVSGYRPLETSLLAVAKETTLRRLATLVAVLLVLSLILTGMSALSYISTEYENQMHEEVSETVSSPKYDDVRLVETESTGLQDAIFFGERLELIVVVDAETQSDDGLARDIRNRLTARFGIPVAVEVDAVEYAAPQRNGTAFDGSGFQNPPWSDQFRTRDSARNRSSRDSTDEPTDGTRRQVDGVRTVGHGH